MSAVRVLERQLLAVPLGVKFRNAADRLIVRDSLDIHASAKAQPLRRFPLSSTPSGHWAAHVIPGVGADLAQNPAAWSAQAKPYLFEAIDPTGRYLPLRFEAPLPSRGSLVWPGWAGVNRSRIAPLLPPGSGASFVPDYLPLFPSVAAGTSPALAQIRAHLAMRQPGGALRDAAWALVTISYGSAVVGLGLSNGRGAVAISFAYPQMPPQTAAEASTGRPAIEWPVRARVYWSDLGDPNNPEAPPPDFSAIIGQLAQPARVAIATIQGSQPALGDQMLTLGRPLILRTKLTANSFASSLYLKPA